MNPQIDLALILGLSIVVYSLATYGNWYYHCHGHADAPVLRRLRGKIPRSPVWSWTYHAGRFAYYIGLPYLALRQGIIPASTMGLGEWTATSDDVLVTSGLALAAFVILSVTQRSYSRSLPDQTETSRAQSQGRHWVTATLDVLYLEVHWAFYRSGPIFWLGGDYYTGSFLGFLLITLEELLNPRVRNALKRPQTSIAVLVRWSIALCMTTVFYFSRSLWLVIGLHWLVEMGSLCVQRALSHKVSFQNDAPSLDETA